MISRWLQSRRRRQLLSRPLPRGWEETLLGGVRHYRWLPAEQRLRVQQIVAVMMAEKDWAGAGDFELTEPMRLAIAGQAAVMVSGVEKPYFFDRLHTIVVHPKTIRFSPDQAASNPQLPGSEPLLGVAWYAGPVLISWQAFDRQRRGLEPGQNVVLHEFAHHLDGLDGAVDGLPSLGNPELDRQWYAVSEAEYLRLAGQAQRGEATLLDKYGATNRAEFFAVATECFFELPHQLQERHRGLYDSLAAFYRQDPADWMPRDSQSAEAVAASSARRQRGSRGRGARPRRGLRRANGEGPGAALRATHHLSDVDALFSLGLAHLRAGRPEDAVRALGEVIAVDPRDEEALAHRAIAHWQCGDVAQALQDSEAALAIDPGDVDALCVRAGVRLENGDARGAVEDLDEAVALAPRDLDALLSRAEALLALSQAKRALRDADEALAVDPHLAEAHWLRGAANEMLGRPQRAAQDRQRALLIDPAVARQFAKEE